MNKFNSTINELKTSSSFLKGVHVLQILVAGLIVLNILIFHGIFLSSQGILGYRQRCAHVEELTQKIKKLREQNHKLFRKIQALKKDPRAQEKLVRQQLGWAAENEIVVEFVPSKKPSP